MSWTDAMVTLWKKEESKGKWISINDGLPDEDVPVVVFQPNTHKHLESFVCAIHNGVWRPFEEHDIENNGKYESGVWYDEITHWMPLPEPPNT